MSDFIFRGTLSDLDPAVAELIDVEAARQDGKLILIPSESAAPDAVREALGSVFQNIYAEGYPDEEQRWMSEEEILDYPSRLAHFRRYADPRYYKGTEYADLIESLARRRCAELFATPATLADRLYVNVQPLSGAPANNAVYTALINPGDTILGMNLLHGGHLTHGSSANRSGKLFKAVHYAVDPVTEKIDYENVQAIASEHNPRIIIAGYSSYSWAPDWKRFREIADSVGAYLLTDISHIAGLIAAGVIPSPIDHAHVVTFTTHKTLCGPRGAVVVTSDAALARKIDRGVFPGEQGGPHVHAIAAMAATFKIARTDAFRQLQQQIVDNCAALNQQLIKRGLRIPFNGGDTHLTNIDCKTVVGPDGTPLSGDIAARILDLVGLVLNRNTIPGDKNALVASGIRLGTPWMTQRGLKEDDMREVANVIADVFAATTPYTIEQKGGPAQRAKVDFEVFENAKLRICKLVEKTRPAGAVNLAYPHAFFIDDQPVRPGKWTSLSITGEQADSLANLVFSADVEGLREGESKPAQLITPTKAVSGVITFCPDTSYQFSFPSEHFGLVSAWLRDLSDGFVAFDADVTRRIPGPVVIEESHALPVTSAVGDPVSKTKAWFIGKQPAEAGASARSAFAWTEAEPETLKRTSLYEIHKQLGARLVPFAGWEMPVQYTGVAEEHLATRQAAGLFDVSHMGVYQAEGPYAVAFLDSVCGNDIAGLAVGESCYTHFLDPHANVIDDTLVYRRSDDKYLVVVNAANDDKDWAWLNAVKSGTVEVEPGDPSALAFGRQVTLRNLRDPQAGADMRVDIALQGPKSREILLALGVSPAERRKVMALKRTQLCEAIVGGFDLVVSRTGYTGERMAFELFVHPEQAPALWQALLSAGEPLGLKPCGLGARDSLRTEAGLPLYGHEMAGELGLGVAEAGFGSYVKAYKPWFIGRSAFVEREAKRSVVVVRFRFAEKGVRLAHLGDPVLDQKGRRIGTVTSCSLDSEGFLTGQAVVEFKSAGEGAPLWIYQSASRTAGKAPADLKNGDRVTLPTQAVVVSRFPKLAAA